MVKACGVPVLPLCDPPFGASIAVSKAVQRLLEAQQSAGSYCPVVLNLECWWPHEIAVVLSCGREWGE